MSGSNSQASFSPDERQRTKSRSSSRSNRTLSNTIKHEADRRRAKTASSVSKRSGRETNSTKHSGSPRSNRSTNLVSSALNTSKKQQSNTKTTTSTSSKSKSPSSSHKDDLKRKKSSKTISDIESKEVSKPNDSQRQDLSFRGLSAVPAEIFQCKCKHYCLLLQNLSILFQVISLRQLILSNNNLSNIPTNIRSLINLEYLDISKNPLRTHKGSDDSPCLPHEFSYLRKFHTLIMVECSLKEIPAVVWEITSLQKLDISRNKIKYIAGEISKLRNFVQKKNSMNV